MVEGKRRVRDRLRSLLTAIVCIFAVFACRPAVGASDRNDATQEGGQPADPAIKAAGFRAKDLKGQTIDLSELLKEGPVFLHFWTTWCPSCQREMTKLDAIGRRYRDNGFHVVAIAQDDAKTLQKVKPLISSKKFVMTVIVDSNKEIGNLYNVRQYPTCYLIAKDGSIVHYAQGYLPGDEERIEELVRNLLGLAPLPAGRERTP